MTDDNWEEDFWTNESGLKCPKCGSSDIVVPTGSLDSKVLLIGDEPEDEDVNASKAWVGRYSAILKTEFGKAGLDYKNFRKTNLWVHPNNKKPECIQYGLSEILKECNGKTHIILIGKEITKLLTGKSASQYYGLMVKSDYISGPYIFVFPPVSTIFSDGMGELRLAIEKFQMRYEGF